MSNKASLFKFEANLLPNGKVELLCESVKPEEFEGVINNGLPEYDGAHSIASLLRYLKSWSDEALEKSARYI
jgi:hypothetical protein